MVSFVSNGGTAVVSFWSGIVDEHDAVYLGPYGGPLRPLMGCDVLEVAPQRQGDVLEVEWEDGTKTTATFWADVAVERDGHVLARIASGPWCSTVADGLSGGIGLLVLEGDAAGLAAKVSELAAVRRDAPPDAHGESESNGDDPQANRRDAPAPLIHSRDS